MAGKYLYPQFFSYIKKFDLFALYETHVVIDESNEIVNRYQKFLGGFQLVWVSAVKHSEFGRAIGGILLGVSNKLKTENIQTSFEKFNERNYIKIKCENETIIFSPYISDRKRGTRI